MASNNEEDLLSVCFTGTCPNYSRAELTEMVEDLYEVKDSVTKDLDILVCEDLNSGSSKLQKAEKYGVKIMSYEEFLEMVENDGENDEEDEEDSDEDEDWDEDDDDEEVVTGPVSKVVVIGRDPEDGEIPVERIWFANDKVVITNEASENCIGIEAINYECSTDNDDNFVCQWQGVNLITTDKDGNEVRILDWRVNDLVATIKEKGLVIRNLYAGLEDSAYDVVISSITFVEDGKEYELKDGIEGMQPCYIPEENQLRDLVAELERPNPKINEKKVAKVGKVYGIHNLPEQLKKMISKCNADDENSLYRGGVERARILSYDELINPEDYFDLDFAKLGYVPVLDLFGGEQFIAYNSKKKTWIWVEVDGTISFENEDLREVICVYDDDVD